MARAAVSMRPSAHSPLDNVSTKYNPIRLLKGAPPGQVIIQNKIFCIESAKLSLLPVRKHPRLCFCLQYLEIQQKVLQALDSSFYTK